MVAVPGETRSYADAQSRKAFFEMTLLAALCLGFAIWATGGEERGVSRAAPTVRAGVYERTLADLRLCRDAATADLEVFCTQTAARAIVLPECDDACRALAQPWRGAHR